MGEPFVIDALRAEVATLTTRLDRGLDKIEQGRARGENVSGLESFWCNLLRQYESAYDRLAAAEKGE